MPTFNDIVPQEDQAQLSTWGDVFDSGYWTIGDITNRLIALHKPNGDVTQQQIYAAVAYYCRRSAASVRRYAAVAAFYPQEERRKYAELLSFDHYAHAMSFGNESGKKLENAAYGGFNEQPLSVDVMMAQDAPPEPPAPKPFEPEVIADNGMVTYEAEAPNISDNIPEMATIRYALGLLSKNVRRLISPSAAQKLAQGLELIDEALAELNVSVRQS